MRHAGAVVFYVLDFNAYGIRINLMYKKTAVEPTSGTASVVASNVRAEAARQGYSQVKLAKALGLTQNMVTKRWKNEVAWQLAELDLVADTLGVSVMDLVTPINSIKPDILGQQIETVNKAMGINAATALLKQYAIRDSNPEPTD